MRGRPIAALPLLDGASLSTAAARERDWGAMLWRDAQAFHDNGVQVGANEVRAKTTAAYEG